MRAAAWPAASKAIALHTETEISRLDGSRHLEQVTWRHRRTGAEERRAISNVFLMLGGSDLPTARARQPINLDRAVDPPASQGSSSAASLR